MGLWQSSPSYGHTRRCLWLYRVSWGPVITVDFLWLYPAGMPLGVEGGIFPAIIGSILEGLLTASMAAIVSIPCALYMVYGNISRWKSECFLFTLRCMSGLPSVLIGLFGYSVLILYFRYR